MIIINTIDSNTFELNGKTYAKVYELRYSGYDDNVDIVNIENERDVILSRVSVTKIKFDGVIYNDYESLDSNMSNSLFKCDVGITTGPIKVYYNRPAPKQYPISGDYDEGDLYRLGFDTFIPIPQDGTLQQLDYSVDVDYLVYFNSFGHKFRLTGLNGGYYDFNDGQYKDVNGNLSTFQAEFSDPLNLTAPVGYIIDHYTGIGYYTKRGGATTFFNALTSVWNSSLLGLTGWFTPWHDLGITLFRADVAKWLYPAYRPPFQFDQANAWSCTHSGTNPAKSYYFRLNNTSLLINKRSSLNRFYARLHFSRTDYVIQP